MAPWRAATRDISRIIDSVKTAVRWEVRGMPGRDQGIFSTVPTFRGAFTRGTAPGFAATIASTFTL